MKAVLAKPATVWVIILTAILIAHPLIIAVTPGNAGIEETITIPVLRRAKESTAAGLGRVALRLQEGADHPRSSARNSGARRPCLKDGRELIVSYVGESRLVSQMQSGNARALSLASADFDGDGIPDLAAGYSLEPSGGVVAIHRGNPDAIYQNTAEAQARRARGEATNSPFLSPAALVALPVAPALLGTGDFNDDGQFDIVAAAKGGTAFYVLLGDRHGGFGQPVKIALPGRTTAMSVSDVNRRDGYADILIAVTGASGSRLLVFEGPKGAMNAIPEVIELPAPASSIACGRLLNRPFVDIAVAAGSNVVLVHGRDRKIFVPENMRKVAPPSIWLFDLGAPASSIVIGNFSGGASDEIAALGDEGSIRILPNPDESDSVSRETSRDELINAPQRAVARARIAAPPGTFGRGRLIKATIWGHHDDLVAVDSQNYRLVMLDGAPLQQLSAESVVEADGSPVDVLPMRLNSDGLSDLVVLRTRSVTPAILTTQSNHVFTVTNTNDSGPGSLRSAIILANNSSGVNAEIDFDIPGAPPFTIRPQTVLPEIDVPLIIDGTTQPGFAVSPVIELDGEDEPLGNRGLVLGPDSGPTVVRGLAINSFADSDCIFMHGDANTHRFPSGFIIEGNYVGTGTQGLAIGKTLDEDSEIGIDVQEVRSALIGGIAPSAKNVISGCLRGIELHEEPPFFAAIVGNYIGLDATGGHAFGNGVGVVDIGYGATIGEPVPGGRNIISGNLGAGLELGCIGSQAVLVQNNYIGTDATGSAPVPNLGPGILVAGSMGVTIGGPGLGGNLISGNKGDGIDLESAVDTPPFEGFFPPPCSTRTTSEINVIDNLIGTDGSGSNPLGNQANGILIGALIGVDKNTAQHIRLPFDNLFTGNTIAFNGTGSDPDNKSGIRLPDTESVNLEQLMNRIISNFIFSNAGLGIDLGKTGVTENPGNINDGPNKLQNFPSVNSSNMAAVSTTSAKAPRIAAAADGASITVSGKMSAKANTAYTLEFYLGSDCQGSGHELFGTLPLLLGSTSVTTGDNHDANGTGDATYSATFSLAHAPSSSGFINATATDPVGNTSEFSACAPVSITPTCSFALSSSSVSFGPSGGTATVGVVAGNHCDWSTTSNTPWVTVVSGAGSGNGVAKLQVAPNSDPAARSTVVTIAGIGFTISEDGAGAGCTFSIDPSSQNFPAAGGSGFLRVTAESACQWTAAQNPDGTFITVTSGATGSGNGSVAYQVSPNPTTNSRSGTLKVAGHTFTVTQSGLPVITAANLQGKNLIVTGHNFDADSVIVINGMDEVTLHDPVNLDSLTGKKSRKHIPVGTPVNVQVRNSDGNISPVFQFARN